MGDLLYGMLFIRLNIRVLHILVTVSRNKLLTCGEIVAKQCIEDLLGKCGVSGSYRDKTARFGIHCSLPHHFGRVFTKSLGTLKSVFLISKLLYYFCLFKLVISEIYFILSGDLDERRFGNNSLVLAQKRREQTVEKRQQKRADLESVLIGIGAYDDF